MRSVIAAAVLIAAISVAALVAWQLQRDIPIARVLGRDLQPGMALAEVTAHLRRLGVEFTTDATPEGTALVRFGREVAANGMVSEQQIVFDAKERMLGLRDRFWIAGR